MSKPVVAVDFFPSPKSFGLFGMVLFFLGVILIILIWSNVGLIPAILCIVIWVDGVYLGRSIESQYHKHKDEISKRIKVVVDEKEKTCK